MEEIKKKRLKEIISSIGEIRGRHTELVTVYVPTGFNLAKIVDMLRTEQSTAQNIKSKAVRKNVLGALEKILQHLKLYKKTPDNGLVLFCGNASEKEGVADIELWSIEPPEPVKNKLYWCGQNFITDPLKEMVKEREIYGLIVLDRSEAEIGILKGKKVESLKHMESIVPGKTKAGGWCVHEDTLIQLHDGRISKIKDLGENQFICYDMRGLKQRIGKHNHFFSRKSKSALEIKTIAPTEKIIVTSEHKFFFLNEGGIGEKSAGDIKIGDMLLGLRYSTVNGKLELDRDYAQLLGYILGDGDTEKTRITLSEGEQSLAEIYRNLVENSLVLNTSLGERKGKGYWQLRIYGKAFVENVKKDFPDIVSTTGKNIPDKICMLKNDYLACFIRGLYDAEGWIDKSTKLVGITMSSIDVIKKLHQLVMRFGIVGSLKPVKMKGSFAKKMRYCLVITDRRSLENFSKFIGFSSKRKRNELNNALSKSRTSWVDQIPLNGRYALSLIRKLNMTTNDFPESRMFFAGTRKMSYCVFEKNILPRMKKKVKKTGVGKDVLDILSNIMSSDLIGIRVKSIKKMKPTGLFYDLEVPQYQSFVANGLVLHNSQARYARIREGLLNDFLKNVGEIASSKFKEYKDLKGVIIGGPGPIKEQFAEGKFLDYAIKNRALGVVNTSYTGEYGLKEMVNLSEDLISQASIIKEKKILDRFFDELGKDSGLAVYGLEKVMKALESGSVDIVLVSEAFDWIKASMECSCGLKEEKVLGAEQIYKEKCPKCGNVMGVKVKKDLADEIISMAENMGTKVETISVSTSKGEQLKELGAIGGILRFKS